MLLPACHALITAGCMTVRRELQNPKDSLLEIAREKMQLANDEPFDWDHFTHLWKDAMDAERGTEHLLEKAFPFFDQDGSGYITRDEMVQQFQELGGLLTEAEIHEFHDILDSDGNGVIDVRAFVLSIFCGPVFYIYCTLFVLPCHMYGQATWLHCAYHWCMEVNETTAISTVYLLLRSTMHWHI
jgi:EF-hand domain pair